MKKIAISIFIPYYNDETFIEKTVKSCLQQTFTNWELILFDHASTDCSSSIVHKFKDSRIKYIRSDVNLGAGSGKNLSDSLHHMHGKYIKLLCADDIMNPDCLEKLYLYMESHPEKDICFSDMEYIDEFDAPLNTLWSKEIPGVNFENDEKKTLRTMFRGQSHLPYPASFVKKEALESIKLNSTYIMLFDVHLWTSLLIKGYTLGFIPQPLIRYRCHSGQISSIKQIDIASRRGYLEYSDMCYIYFNISDVNIVKFILDDSIYAQKLTEEDKDLIPFVIAYHYITAYLHPHDFPSGCEPFKICGFIKINELLNNNIIAEKIQKKFSYGIKEFRDFYSQQENIKKQENITYIKYIKNKIKNKKASDLSILDIMYIIFRKLYRIILLKDLRHKKRKKYTI